MVYRHDNTKMVQTLVYLIATDDLKLPVASWAGIRMDKSAALAIACRCAGTSPEEVRGNTRTSVIAARRAWVCHLLRARHLSYTQIGSILGRDHSSVLHSCRRVEVALAQVAAAEGRAQSNGKAF